jgi:integrase
VPYADSELSPSTAHGYKGLWKMYLAPHVSEIVLRDMRCSHVNDLLQTLFREHGLSKKSLRNVKGLLSSIFLHAKRAGVIDGENPATDAGIPRKAKGKGVTVAYSVDDVAAMLGALDGSARLAVALIFGAGLRPGEARGVRWPDYVPADNGEGTLSVHASIWRKHEGRPKTEASIGFVPVPEYLAAILATTPRMGEFILAGPSGKPLNLSNLAKREVRPGLKRCATCHLREDEHGGTYHPFKLDQSLPAWKGWYSARRGAGTMATEVSKDNGLAAKSLLRHSNIATAQVHYIKSVPAEAVRASQMVNARMMAALAVQGDASRPN